MKNFLVAVALMFALVGCTVVEPGPSQVGVLMDKPYIFGTGGVRDEAVPAGREYTWFSTTPIYIEIVPQTQSVVFDDLSSRDNILLDFETSIQYQIIDAPKLVKTKGLEWFQHNVFTQYRSIVRDAVKTVDMSSLMSNPVAAAEVDATVTEKLSALIERENIPVRIINVSLGRAKPNPDVLQQMNLTAAEQQRAKTMVQAELAEVAREKQQRAKARADDAYRQEMGLTPEQYLTFQITNIQAEACKAASNCVVAPPGTSVLVK